MEVSKPPADIQLDITGDWTATRPDGGKIGLGIKQDGGFVWSVTDKGGKKDSFDGTFSLEDNVLILERTSGARADGPRDGACRQQVPVQGPGRWRHRPGLTFTK